MPEEDVKKQLGNVSEAPAEEPANAPEVAHGDISDIMGEHRPVTESIAPVTCSPVMPNGTCGTCGWKWGSAAPHPVYFGMARHEPLPTKTKPAFTPAAPDPKACGAIQFDAVCPKCGWSKGMRDGKAEPHAVNT